MNEFKRCLQQGKIVKTEPSYKMTKKEIESAEYDLEQAGESLKRDDVKWASIQAYYSLFHSAKGLVMLKGYREKGHYCLTVALRELYVKSGELEEKIAADFEHGLDIRHEADYGLTYNRESAELCINAAEDLLSFAKKVLQEKNK